MPEWITLEAEKSKDSFYSLKDFNEDEHPGPLHRDSKEDKSFHILKDLSPHKPSARNDIRGAIWKSKDASAQYHVRQLKKALGKVYTKLARKITKNLEVHRKSNQSDLLDAVDFDVNEWAMQTLEAAKVPLTWASVSAMRDALKEINYDSTKLDNSSEIADEIIDAVSDKVSTMPLVTLKNDLADIIKSGFENGLDTQEIADKLVQKVGNLSEWKAKQVAQTTVTPAYNAAQLKAWQSTGLDADKEWLSMRDEAVRDAHQELDGQIRPIDQPFEWGGSKADHPGAFGEPDLDINCRCYMRPVPKSTKHRIIGVHFVQGELKFIFSGQRLEGDGLIVVKGGPGSGNFGHSSRPGEVGGSGEGGENYDGHDKEHPLKTDDVNVAAKALAQGRYVELSQTSEVSTLLDKLAGIAKEMKAAGKEPPNYDLCRVSVPDTNLFCAENKGYARVDISRSGISYLLKDWNEELHPRDENGRFSSEGGEAEIKLPEPDLSREGLGVALDHWTGSGYHSIREYLRTGYAAHNATPQEASNLLAAIEQKGEESPKLYRGVAADDKAFDYLNSLKEGQDINLSLTSL